MATIMMRSSLIIKWLNLSKLVMFSYMVFNQTHINHYPWTMNYEWWFGFMEVQITHIITNSL